MAHSLIVWICFCCTYASAIFICKISEHADRTDKEVVAYLFRSIGEVVVNSKLRGVLVPCARRKHALNNDKA